MSDLSNAFSLLEVDVADEEDFKAIAAATNGVNSKGTKGFFLVALINDEQIL